MSEPGRQKYVYAFEEGGRDQKYLLGGKGANLAEMTNLGLPVPPGFTISTDACKAYMALGDELPPGLMAEVAVARQQLEQKTGKLLGDADDPLLVSVRSGAPFSMPGMMDTVLNLGLNDNSVKGLAKQTQNERFAYDSYRRFVQMFGKIVLDVSGELFEEALHDLVESKSVSVDTELRAEDMAGLVDTFKGIVKSEAGVDFPTDPQEQLRYAVEAVFKSWNGRRARDYRRLERIPDDLGTAVNVQTMVFGNKGDDSGTGVAFTRNPSTGEHKPYGDFLKNAQGEDVVAGIRITEPLEAMSNEFPGPHMELLGLMKLLEDHYRDMCDIEFTIEQGRLFMLQTRIGKRTAAAALRMAVEMVDEGLIDTTEAVLRIQPAQLDQLLHPQFDPKAKFTVLAKGLNASPGAAVGKVYFTADEAEARHEAGELVILVRPETSPDDLHGMIAAEGILTSRGGLVSHAAVVARGMGKPAICGAEAVKIDLAGRTFTAGDTTVREGDVISINGTTGEIVVGEVPVITPEPSGPFGIILGWADGLRTLKVRTNADLPEDARKAREFGAEGIGLCRTEHMFLGDRLPIVQRMILADTPDDEAAALEELRAQQEADFEGILEAMDGLPVTVRLLDPPLHEFLPDHEELIVKQAKGEITEKELKLLHAAELWRESNPMLGTRGCRLGIIKPGLYRMQVRALMQAVVTRRRAGGNPIVEIMIPLIVSEPELRLLEQWTREEAGKVLRAANIEVDYLVGTMIETPRAALVADGIAEVAEFFSFGTNDLTQMTFGFSRDDVEGRFMSQYLENKLLSANPFETLDVEGVGQLVRMGCERGRATRADLKLGICGEHGGDPASVAFCHEVGLDYVSCSPYRVPIARLAAAHAAVGAGGPGASA
ncbi:MAG: pyruvate, orthophosphate dikinase [Actinomycetota bacterium]|jgi:pyruvate,orthophosphate dikinase|nr:pyruvate, orthophosphate dikinase [Actinomycetota bacterium]